MTANIGIFKPSRMVLVLVTHIPRFKDLLHKALTTQCWALEQSFILFIYFYCFFQFDILMTFNFFLIMCNKMLFDWVWDTWRLWQKQVFSILPGNIVPLMICSNCGLLWAWDHSSLFEFIGKTRLFCRKKNVTLSNLKRYSKSSQCPCWRI